MEKKPQITQVVLKSAIEAGKGGVEIDIPVQVASGVI